MAKRQTKAVIKPFASEETTFNLLPSPIGQYASGGAVTPSFDPEVLLENASQGITKMCVQPNGEIVLPPSGDVAALQYSNDFRITALQEHGIAEYSAVLDYHLNDITRAPSGTKIYRSLVNDNIGNPLTDVAKWEELDLLALKQATISQRGTLQIATITDINAGTDNAKALTVANLRASNINFTGTPTVPTPTTNDNSTKIANTKYVKDNLVSYAPLNNPTFTGGIILAPKTNVEGGAVRFTSPSKPTSYFYWQAHDPTGQSWKYTARLVTVWQNATNVNTISEPIRIKGDENGNITETYIHKGVTDTPATNENSNRMATTFWVRQVAYTKAEVDNSLNLKADKSTTYTKTEVNTALNFPNSKTTNGYTYLPNGLIFQWGYTDEGNGIQKPSVSTFPIAFPNACLNVTGTMINDDGNINFDTHLQLRYFNKTQVNFFIKAGASIFHNLSYNWFAIGF